LYPHSRHPGNRIVAGSAAVAGLDFSISLLRVRPFQQICRQVNLDLFKTPKYSGGMNKTTESGEVGSGGISRRSFLKETAGVAALSMLPRNAVAWSAQSLESGHGGPTNSSSNVKIIRVDVAPDRRVNSFEPNQALGSSMDILPRGVVDKISTEPMVKQCLSAGWGPITYRQNTELQIAAWHWNHNGTWSDAANKSGYFTGDSEPTEFLRHSYGYPLPHRGNTRNGGSERGYSRITDGDRNTYWKSNPYLSRKFTGEDDSRHPQWVILDLGAVAAVNAIRIDWANPCARTYEVQFWTGEDAMDKPTAGVWSLFPSGLVQSGQGGTVVLKLSDSPVRARFIRIWMTASSNTCDTHGPDDPRNCAGYAINEVYCGTFTGEGQFIDLVTHSPGQNQTATYCSSIDPWHSASDLNDHGGDQTGFDLFFTSGITNNLPAMIPVAMLYGTPEDSAAQIAYIKKRGYPVAYVEMGEEPDGQYCMPEDYGALYLQWADAIHRVDPEIKLGGPVFQGVNEDIKVWPDAQGRTSWLGRFVDYLTSHGRISDLAFMSFEHYPFAPCEVTWSDLYKEPELVSHILEVWRDDGLPQNVPMFITESNLSWGLTQPMVDIFAALWLADNAGAFLAAGGSAFYHSPIQPEPLHPGCRGWSTYGNFVADQNLQIESYTSQYFASRLINLEWVKHGAGIHHMFPASCDAEDEGGHVLVTAYAVDRPDGEWSLLIVNRDPSNAHPVHIVFDDATGREQRSFTGSISMITFGSEQYVWHPDGPESHPDPDGPSVTRTLPGGPEATFTLPKASITVLRGTIANAAT
ncbi:MAG: discoidin domain-containing protein, partial [Terriglobia bacterium]